MRSARAVANGNIVDLPDDSPLVAAGIYEWVEESKPAKVSEPAPEPAPEPEPIEEPAAEPEATREAPLLMTTDSIPQAPSKAKRKR